MPAPAAPRRWFGIEPIERGWAVAFGVVLLSNSLASQISDIVAVSGFLSKVGVPQLIAVWAADYLLILGISGLQSLIVDRVDRRRLIVWVSAGFVIVFIALRLGFAFQAPLWLLYSVLYVAGDQQLLFFPLIFWVLAADTVNPTQAQRTFPFISSCGIAGKLAGIGLAAAAPLLLPRFQLAAIDILYVNASIYAVALAISAGRLARLERHDQTYRHEGLRQTLSDGWHFVWRTPAFRFLALSITALIACDLILEFRFYAISEMVFPSTASYQEFYSGYRFAFTLASLLVEGIAVKRLLRRLGLKNALFFQPIGAIIGSAAMIALPGLPTAVGGMILQKLPQGTLDETARKDIETLVPPDRRGRVSILIDSYLYAAGSVIGCVVLGIIVVCQIALNLPHLFYAYLAIALAAAVCALWLAFRFRNSYEDSLLQGALARRKRTSSVLDRLS
ncbi:MAG: hypothetical protein JOZ39_06945 [Chloroflexi bacterium]|nr:hypothetical protein [Chloroflexota bacterium]